MDISNKRILLVDDNAAIHDDFRKVLVADEDLTFENVRQKLFSKKVSYQKLNFKIDSAYQGQEALELVKKSKTNGKPYALVFLDIRMPPGWDGVETAKKLWEVDANLQIVICSAYSDYAWETMAEELKRSSNFLILKKPFDIIEVQQLAYAMTQKWELNKEVQNHIENLEIEVNARTKELRKANQALEKSLSLTESTIEATQEGILAVSDEKVLIVNDIFLKLWDFTENDIQDYEAKKIIDAVSSQIEEPELFKSMMHALCENPKEGIVREWRHKSGMILELYTHPHYLNNKIIGTVFSFRDITERKKLEEQLLYQATHDGLTGLPNRLLLSDRISQAISLAKRHSLMVGVLLFDLDNFKQVNDSLGHKVGDTLLVNVAHILKKFIRESDTVTRLGGDEFVIVLASQPNDMIIQSKAKEILQEFLKPCAFENHQLIVTASIGISVYPRDGEDADSLLKNADAALYRSKDLGRNTFQFYMSEFNEHILQKAELTTALHQALERHEFVLHYQPLVTLQTSQITGVEALLRWNHPTLGQIVPNTFIPLAEETGLIVSIGEWVLKTACTKAKIWQKTINENLIIAVNISPYQFRQHNFVEIVRKILQETQLEPQYLELEITESLILGNTADVMKKMVELKSIGVRLAMDDFGTGYASLSYLKCFPFDKIKIDKSFIEGINENSDDRHIVEAIISMTRTIGLQVLAEGVEKADQIKFLKEHHGDQVQGFYYSPGLDEQHITELLEQKQIKEIT